MPPQTTIQPPQPQPQAPLKMGKFKASIAIASESWALLKQDKEIMWFPVMSAIVSLCALAVMAAIFYVAVLTGNFSNLDHMDEDKLKSVFYPALFIYYLVMFFIVNFFQAGIFIIANGRFNGQNLTFSDGINGALKNSGKIFLWSLISATVGMVLRVVADRLKVVGKIVAAILGAAWNILTYFSLASLIIGQTTIGGSFKESAQIIRKTWGETIIINVGLSFFFGVLTFTWVTVSILVCVLVPTVSMLIIIAALFIIYIIAAAVVSSSLSTIFNLALYQYAKTGIVPRGFSPELIQNAIRAK